MCIKLILVYFSFQLSFSVQATTLLTTAVGRVKDHIVTSREVEIEVLAEKSLELSREKLEQLRLPPLESKPFAELVSAKILEESVYLESQNFSVAGVSNVQLQEAINMANGRLVKIDRWKKLEVTSAELRQALQQHLRAKKFIRFKSDSSSVPVTDAEAQKYYEENQARFGSLPYESFAENIKAFLTKNQSEQRLNDWYEVLRSKYGVRNYLSEI
ncbi:MAG: hypothetical protein KDD22_04465 [Bdellovibrionales bacterium]|nr:hypothetical protein [Bdellovibrionales bacterium]